MGIAKEVKKVDCARGLPTQWMRLLVDYYPLQPIHKQADYKKAIRAAAELVGRKLSAVQGQYLESLSILIENYEDDHFRIDENWSPLEAVRFLVEENGMNASDLGTLLGDRSLGTRILKGQRDLSKAHIRKLADRFSVSPALFI